MSGKRQVPEGDITVRTAVAVVSVKEVDEGHFLCFGAIIIGSPSLDIDLCLSGRLWQIL